MPQMFDIRPVKRSGSLDVEKIKKVGRAVKIPIHQKVSYNFEKDFSEKLEKKEEKQQKENFSINRGYSFKEEPAPKKSNFKKIALNVLKFSAAAFLIFFVFNFVIRGIDIKNNGRSKGESAMADLAAAKDSLTQGDFQKSHTYFSNAHEKLSQVSEQLDGMGLNLANALRYVPYLSKISSANNAFRSGEKLSEAGAIISEILETMEKISSRGAAPAGGQGSALGGKSVNPEGESISYLKLFQDNEQKLSQVSELLGDAEDSLGKVNIEDIPEDQKDEIIEIKKMLPEINRSLADFLDKEQIFVDILGGNGPRKYLFLFQNNQEMRATGGFIGSYALLEIFDGRVKNFFIDGIFNPDGQLRERIVPPVPIQKISANWSLHDSNWFPDFPVSAEKAAWFFEKTGGPTVDGVLTMTPTVMQKLLEITGPIEMSDYDVTIDKDNFIEKIQYEVEIDYDKELNQPKKILADLAPIILDKILNSKNFSDMAKTFNILLESLNEKQILIYSKNWAVEEVLSENRWSGEILNTPKDYVSVINTNINGFKTDGIVDEEIYHQAEIQPDGTIVDNLTVTRTHKGGDTPYDWWNKVNSDYMRVYVPKGSRLISASGQTREFNDPPLDYDALGYKRDPQVQMENDSIAIDEENGTRVYEDQGKTVFANWVYVSPKETVTLKYTYVLPFKVDFDGEDAADSYSILAQKQSGSLGSKFISEVKYPKSYRTLWSYPEENISNIDGLPDGEIGVKMETVLDIDRFLGMAFAK